MEAGDAGTDRAALRRAREMLERAERQRLCLAFEALFEEFPKLSRLIARVRAGAKAKDELALSHPSSGPRMDAKEVTSFRARALEFLHDWSALEGSVVWLLYRDRGCSLADDESPKTVGRRILGERAHDEWMARREGAKIAAETLPGAKAGKRQAL